MRPRPCGLVAALLAILSAGESVELLFPVPKPLFAGGDMQAFPCKLTRTTRPITTATVVVVVVGKTVHRPTLGTTRACNLPQHNSENMREC
jgi:hypothetical protein